MRLPLLIPDWTAPPRVRALCTTRLGGVSAGAYDSLNLGAHVGDDPAHVRQNREKLVMAARLPAEPRWLTQVHGTTVVDARPGSSRAPEADATFTRSPGQVCVIMTADCLPVLFCDRQGRTVAAAHAGWRGLAAGVLPATIKAMGCEPRELLAWLGPAIGPRAFEVGDEVRQVFINQAAEAAACFQPHADRWLADLYGLARQQLSRLGVTDITGGDFCTHEDAGRFFSYRRDGVCGRMASLIWLDA